MCREEQVPEGLDTRCICLDISAGEIVELMHHPVERSAAQEKKAEREHSPAQQHRRSEEHTSELQSLMRISYAVFCLKKKRECERDKVTSNTRTEYNETD